MPLRIAPCRTGKEGGAMPSGIAPYGLLSTRPTNVPLGRGRPFCSPDGLGRRIGSEGYGGAMMHQALCQINPLCRRAVPGARYPDRGCLVPEGVSRAVQSASPDPHADHGVDLILVGLQFAGRCAD